MCYKKVIKYIIQADFFSIFFSFFFSSSRKRKFFGCLYVWFFLLFARSSGSINCYENKGNTKLKQKLEERICLSLREKKTGPGL